ncbi:hypothetical protein FACS189447_10310 [Spirochaetia bacterium]|nr:hypothetical protein FACS189447_10310 [Spirochaetia bacterium]
MPITQTVEIPANHRLTIDVPCKIPVGRAKIVIFPESDAKPSPKKKTSPEEKKRKIKTAIEAAWGSAKDSPLTSDHFLEMKRKDLALENALDPMKRGKQG